MPLLKDIYNDRFFDSLCQALRIAYLNFDEDKLRTLIFDDAWKSIELKERMRHICISLHEILTQNYAKDIEILKKTASIIEIHDKYSELSLIIFATYVEIFGIDDFDISMKALEYFTSYGSSEFAIRHFVNHNPEKSLKIIYGWSNSNSAHVRRLASEGVRPRLPWGIALNQFKKDPKPIIPILENLKDDPSEYVRRSIANNLNDISKDNPKIALEIAKSWYNNDQNRVRLVKHGLRSLLKKGDSVALNLFGINSSQYSRIELFDLKKTEITVGENLEFSFKLVNQKKSKIRLEYAIYFLMKNQSLSKKIFQIFEREIAKEEILFKKHHSFRVITTRNYYSGIHKIALILNGVEVISQNFHLKLLI